MKKGNTDPMAASQQAELEALAALSDDTIGISDVPPTKDFTGSIRGAFFRRVDKPKR